MIIIDIIAILTLIVTIILAPATFVSWFKYALSNQQNQNLGDKQHWVVTTIFIITCILTMSLFSTIKTHGYNEFLNTLEVLRPLEITIEINHRKVDTAHALADFNKIQRMRPHNSSPISKVPVRIVTQTQTYHLEIGRDSQNPNEFWIFYPKFLVTTYNEIGRIHSDFLGQFFN